VSSSLALVSWPAPVVSGTVIGIALLTALVGLVLALLNRPTPPWALGLLGILEVALIALTIACIVAWVGGTAPAQPVVFVLYLLFCLAIPPAMVWWARGEPSRWGGGVVAAAGVVLAVMILRVIQVWTGNV
jgi:hypothetical protein